jgi:porphobilinogen synthase
MAFPHTRMRRLRKNATIRAMVRETRLGVHDLVLPLFVCPGDAVRDPVPSMPGVHRFSIDQLILEAHKAVDVGIPGILLFGIPESKDEHGHCGCEDGGIVQSAVRALKKAVPNLYVITDVCNCEYTTHGHCGPVVDGDVHNDQTLDILARQAVSHARAGADMVAPSDMMDGRVKRLREALDNEGFCDLPIMSYAAKYSSAFYGPFRDAADSTPQFGDRKTYQMDPANADEALREVRLDVDEGADVVMVKPALSYLDIVWRVKQEFKIPVAAYNVSGEYSLLKAGAQRGWVDEDRLIVEILTSIRRAGADIIISYHALEAARLLG